MLLEECNQKPFNSQLFEEYVNSDMFLDNSAYNNYIYHELYEVSFQDALKRIGGGIKKGVDIGRDIFRRARNVFTDYIINGKTMNDIIADAKLPIDKAKEVADGTMSLIKDKIDDKGTIQKDDAATILDQLRGEIAKIEKGDTFRDIIEPDQTDVYSGDVGDLSLSDLGGNIERGFPRTTKRQFSTQPIRISQLKIVAYPSKGGLLATGSATSGSRKPVVYSPQIFFDGVKYGAENNAQNVTFKASDGNEYHITKLSLQGNNVKTNCNCLDFFHRFAHYNDDHDALYGKRPPPYQRKTDYMPPVNPMQVPGMCKHIIKLSQSLTQANLLS